MQHVFICVCVLQPVGTGLDVLEGRPKLIAWRDRVKQEVGEELFDEAHEQLMNMSSLQEKMQNNSAMEMLKPKFQMLFK